VAKLDAAPIPPVTVERPAPDALPPAPDQPTP
jgi:hypothetical protein